MSDAKERQAKIDAALETAKAVVTACLGSRIVISPGPGWDMQVGDKVVPKQNFDCLSAAYREQQEQLQMAREALRFLLSQFKKIKEAPSRPTHYESAVLRQDKLNDIRKVLAKIGGEHD